MPHTLSLQLVNPRLCRSKHPEHLSSVPRAMTLYGTEVSAFAAAITLARCVVYRGVPAPLKMATYCKISSNRELHER